MRQLVLEKGAFALVLGLSGAILLLLIGTSLLDWYWPVLLAAVSLAVGVYQVRHHLPSPYQLAQRIDHHAGLCDAISTAHYFVEHSTENLKGESEEVRALQQQCAEELARGVNLDLALPAPRSRYGVIAGGLLLIALGLFALRYVVVGSLDLKPSLLTMAVDTFFQNEPDEVAALQPEPKMAPANFAANNGEPPENGTDAVAVPQPNQDDQSLFNPSGADQLIQQDKGANQSDNANKQKGDQKGEPSGEQQEGADQESGDQSSPDDQGANQEGTPSSQNPSRDQSDSSMLDKLRDALANMLNKMTDNDKQSEQANNNQDQQKQQSEGEKGGEQGKQDQQSQGQQQADGSQQASEQGEAQQATNSNQPGQPSEQAASGSGSSEGKKDIEQAALLQAMGDVSELLMQRSENVTGQVMMEVGETKQTLRTELSTQQAGHSEAGSRIHRDEIPRIQQPYVERYFEQVHRAASQAAKQADQPATAKQPQQNGPVVATPVGRAK